MGATAISVCIVLYLATGCNCAFRGDVPHAIMWIAYAVANVGLLLHEMQQ